MRLSISFPSLLFCTSSMQVVMVEGCSRVFQNKYDTMVSARSMDWDHSFNDILLINPRGLEMDGGDDVNPATWTSKYGSVTSSIIGYKDEIPDCTDMIFFEDMSTDGVNEKGLGAHVLYVSNVLAASSIRL